MKTKFYSRIFFALLLSGIANAQEILPEAKETFVGKDFATLILMQEQNGKRGFKLTFDTPKRSANETSFEIAGYTVTAIDYPFEKGEQTLATKYIATKDKQKREIVTLYNAYLSLTSGTDDDYFYVAEGYEKSIRYYAMFKSRPTIEQLKPILDKSLTNPDSALAATKWAGKESEIFIYDSTRLTK